MNYKDWDELNNIAVQVNGDGGDRDKSGYVDEVDEDVRTMRQFASSVRRRNELLTPPDSPQWISTVKTDTVVLRCQVTAVAERRRLMEKIRTDREVTTLGCQEEGVVLNITNPNME